MRLPLTLRIVFHGVRSFWTATLLAMVVWLGLASATPAERTALGGRIGEDRPAGLVPMRIARAMVHFAPQRAAQMLSDATDGELSAEYALLILQDMAAGPVARQEAFEKIVAPPTSTRQPSTRQVGDAKFMRVGE